MIRHYLPQLIDENEQNVETIKNFHLKNEQKDQELKDLKLVNNSLKKKIQLLENELDLFKEQYDDNIGDKCKKLNLTEDNVKILELELARVNSKLDQNIFELNDIKNNYLNQVKIVILINFLNDFKY